MKREITTLPKTAIIIDNSPKKFPLLHAKELLPSGSGSFALCGFFDMKIVRGKVPFRDDFAFWKVPFRDDDDKESLILQGLRCFLLLSTYKAMNEGILI